MSGEDNRAPSSSPVTPYMEIKPTSWCRFCQFCRLFFLAGIGLVFGRLSNSSAGCVSIFPFHLFSLPNKKWITLLLTQSILHYQLVSNFSERQCKNRFFYLHNLFYTAISFENFVLLASSVIHFWFTNSPQSAHSWTWNIQSTAAVISSLKFANNFMGKNIKFLRDCDGVKFLRHGNDRSRKKLCSKCRQRRRSFFHRRRRRRLSKKFPNQPAHSFSDRLCDNSGVPTLWKREHECAQIGQWH